jgi:hypothetical protein
MASSFLYGEQICPLRNLQSTSILLFSLIDIYGQFHMEYEPISMHARILRLGEEELLIRGLHLIGINKLFLEETIVFHEILLTEQRYCFVERSSILQ